MSTNYKYINGDPEKVWVLLYTQTCTHNMEPGDEAKNVLRFGGVFKTKADATEASKELQELRKDFAIIEPFIVYTHLNALYLLTNQPNNK